MSSLVKKPIGSFSFNNPNSQGYSHSLGFSGGLSSIISNILGIITLIAGVSFLVYFILGAINWITSAGDTNKIQTARQQVLNAVIGITITAISYPAVYVISQLLGVPFKDPETLFNSLLF